MTTTKTCTNKGCSRQYVDAENDDQACRYHPGPPVFHEGTKGWSCCQRRVLSFDEFLQIEGCAVGPHSDAQPPPPAAPPAAAETQSIPLTMTTIAATQPTIAQIKQPVKQLPVKQLPIDDDDDDPEDAVIPEGAKCKRAGCAYVFRNDNVSRGCGDEAECTYHPGSPVFHEGSKGYSCCSRKVLEFDEFLKIAGCKKGKHLFVGTKSAAAVKQELAEYATCRHDWYQSPTQVVMTIYAKQVDPATATITFEEQRKYKFEANLFQPIIAAESKFRFTPSKLEITLQKANGISWASLEPTDDIKTWTTFGCTGSVGTVGAKEMVLANDSPLLALNR